MPTNGMTVCAFWEMAHLPIIHLTASIVLLLLSSGPSRAQHDCPPAPDCAPSDQSSRFRTIDGTCNNLNEPLQGAAMRPYRRLVDAKYADGLWQPALAGSGSPMPNARQLSMAMFGETEMQHPRHTMVSMQFGQLMAHDVSFTADAFGMQCCADGKMVPADQARSPRCLPIEVARDDPVMAEEGIECLNMVRTKTTLEDPCQGRAGPAEQLSSVTSYLDLSVVYGNSLEESHELRTFEGGLMRVEHRYGRDWPPYFPNRTQLCDVKDEKEACYLTGDRRANQSPHLALLQIAFLLEHNRLARELAILNPRWDDERTFQEARQINIGQYQAIVYYEWLPIYLGRQNLVAYGVLPEVGSQPDFIDDYDPSADATVSNAFGNAALRFFHNLIAGHLDLVEESLQPTGSIRLSDWLDRPSVLELDGNYEKLSRGMINQPHDRPNFHLTPEVKHFLFRSGAPVGTDLKAIDIQRARDHGLASYNAYRQFCGLKAVRRWDEFEELLRPISAAAIPAQYESVEDVELAVAGPLERHHRDGMPGETFTCILLEQLRRSRVGDRFFFENGQTGLSRRQVHELRKASMARILCDNTVGLERMQRRAFFLVSEDNPVVPCEQLPVVELMRWRTVEP
ncbi:peroxidase-like [Anopheles darlingi]|uniref:peroxidase-like n=1 Tax=Anopheles darlingi TaxID=43151 RepID=UPI0021003EFB|nr:peroxidase-like [Anopheles darlingi]